MGLDMFLVKYTDAKRKNGTEIAYWRKANQIREWFANIIGMDNNGVVYGEVDELILEDLLKVCKNVIKHCPLVEGKVKVGYKGTENGMEPVIQEGKVMTNVKYAEEHLPTSDGFFFGSTDYDEYYIRDLEDTIKQIKEVLKSTDWEKDCVMYEESW